MSDPQPPKSMKLDEFLTTQAKTTTKAVVEAVPGDTTQIKLTPWTSGGGCGCGSAIVLPKSAIASVTPTGDTHFCCGKELSVVVVEFAMGASLNLTELFQQLAANSAPKMGAMPSAPDVNLSRKLRPRARVMVGGPACEWEYCDRGVRYCVTDEGVAWAAGSC